MRPDRSARRGHPYLLHLLIVGLAVVAVREPAGGQEPGASIHFLRYSVDEGLPQSGVGGIAQDPLGFLWLATQDGLTRYDGYTFTTFRHDPQDSTSLPSNQLRSVLVDRAGNLWGSSNEGVWRVRAPSFGRTLDMSGSSASEAVTRDEALVFERLPTESNELGGSAGALLLESDAGRIWTTLGGELAYWDPERQALVAAEGVDSAPSARLPPRVATVVGRTRPPGWNGAREWRRDRDGVYWVALDDPWELARYDPGTHELALFRHDPSDPRSLGAGEIFAIFEDRWGELWVGTGRGGLNRVIRRGIRFTHVANRPGAVQRLPSNYVTGIAVSPDGAVWVGTDSGLRRIEPDGSLGLTLRAGRGARSLDAAYVRGVVATRSGSVFIGAGSTLHLADATTGDVRRLSPPDGSELMSAAVAVDELDDVWAAFLSPTGEAVVHRIDGRTGAFGERFLLMAAAAESPVNLDALQSLHVHWDGSVWAGTWERGLYRLEPGTGVVRRWTSDPVDDSSLPHNTVQVITEDRSGELWVGTRGGGMARFDEGAGAFRRVGTAEGLPNDVVYGIVVDRGGFLWISTNLGLSRFDPRREAFRSFDVSDGLQSNEFNRWAFAQAPSGELIFGGINGITRFQPSALEPNTLPPLVTLESLSVGNRVVAMGRAAAGLRGVRLAHDQNLLTFEYLGLHSTDPSEIRYAYRLEGVEDDWVDVGSRRYVNYANLDPGDYTFRVRAATGAGVWSEEEYALALTVLPPVWRTWWFATLVAMAAAGLLLAVHRYRLATLLREERIRTRIARDLHDDVSATLSSVAYFAEAIRDDVSDLDRPRADRFLDLISRSSAEARDRIGDLIWAISPEHQSWESLLARIRRYASDTLDGHGIRHEIVLPESIASRPLRSDRRRHLWLILKEMTTNATRHAQCTAVRIALVAEGRRLRLVVEDDGVGFDAEAAREGNGVSNIFARASELGAEVTLDTGEGLGTRWELRFRA